MSKSTRQHNELHFLEDEFDSSDSSVEGGTKENVAPAKSFHIRRHTYVERCT